MPVLYGMHTNITQEMQNTENVNGVCSSNGKKVVHHSPLTVSTVSAALVIKNILAFV